MKKKTHLANVITVVFVLIVAALVTLWLMGWLWAKA